jgi:large subunit ribosomal protein L10
MPTDAKRATVAELTEAFSASPASIVSDYRGLTVTELGTIRRSLREQQVQYRIVKNRLAKIAAEHAGITELAGLLEGPTAIALGPTDEAALAKAFIDAVRPYRTVTIRGGVVRGKLVDGAAVSRLATLPPREQLLSQLAGGIASPLSTMAGLLNAPLRNLAYALAQLAEQRGANAA